MVDGLMGQKWIGEGVMIEKPPIKLIKPSNLSSVAFGQGGPVLRSPGEGGLSSKPFSPSSAKLPSGAEFAMVGKDWGLVD
jgi:hypothetical protein